MCLAVFLTTLKIFCIRVSTVAPSTFALNPNGGIKLNSRISSVIVYFSQFYLLCGGSTTYKQFLIQYARHVTAQG